MSLDLTLLIPGISDSYVDRILNYNPIALYVLDEGSGSVARCSVDPSQQNGTHSGVRPGDPVLVEGYPSAYYDGALAVTDVFSTTLRDKIDVSQGMIMGWAAGESAGVWEDGTQRYMVNVYADANNQLDIRKLGGGNDSLFYAQYRAGGVTQGMNINMETRGIGASVFHWAYYWDTAADKARLYVNGTPPGGWNTGLGTWVGAITQINIGSRTSTPSEVWHGRAGFLAFFDYVDTNVIADLCQV